MRSNSRAGTLSAVRMSAVTEHAMLTGASERLNRKPTPGERAQGLFLALLVQASFIAMILLSAQRPVPLRTLAHETILILHPTPQIAPQSIDARGSARRPVPVITPTSPAIAPAPPFAPAPDIAPPSGIAGFGRSLFGCAPEHYADLPPDERAHCPKPGESMAVNQPPDLLNPPKSHAKDEATWQEQWAEDHYMPPICPPSNTPVGFCVLEHAIAENGRRQAAWQKIGDEKAARLQEPKRSPPNIGVRRN